MPLHHGDNYADGDVSIGPPDVKRIRAASKAGDVARNVEKWLSRALERDDVHYLAISWRDQIVGQIFLHDIDPHTRKALVGYHLFEPRFRGRGIGTKALALLQRYVTQETTLTKVVAITSDDNIASQRIAQKCGFAHVGAPREDPLHGMCFEWEAPRTAD